MRIYAFSDEASSALDGQILALKRNGLDGMEIRGVDGQNVAGITTQKAAEVLKKLKDNGLEVWSVGSPIGKILLDAGGFEEHLDSLKHVLEIAEKLECRNIRMFSFYIPEGVPFDDCRNDVIDRLGRMAETARGTGIALCHENEKGIYGDMASRCLEILEAVPDLKCVFDPANFIQCGQDVKEAWKMLGDRVYYMHIKDALPDGTVVPAGKGVGHLREILKDYLSRGGEALTLEPHLRVFDGLKALERDQKTQIAENTWPTADKAFDAAAEALRALL